MIYFENEKGKLYYGDVFSEVNLLESHSVNTIITSPPYWAVRDYDDPNQLGQEPHVRDYVDHLVNIFNELKRVTTPDGSLFVNIGDVYYGGNKGTGGKSSKQLSNKGSFHDAVNNYGKRFNNKEFPEKTLTNIPARLSVALQDVGWNLRNTVIWYKPNVFVTSAKDSFTMDFEYLYWFVKDTHNYYFDQQFESTTDGKSIRNMRTVWEIVNGQNSYKHYAGFPKKLVETPIKATCPINGVVLDPFIGSGTTAVVAQELNRNWIGVDINKEYLDIVIERVTS